MKKSDRQMAGIRTLKSEGMNEIEKLPEGTDRKWTRGEKGHRRWMDR